MKRIKKKTKIKVSRQQVFNRYMLIVAILVIWIGGIGARLVHLQVQQHDWLKNKAENQRSNIKRSKLLRGTIYDRDGRVLAMSVTAKTLYADATEIEDIESTAKSIAKLTSANENSLLKLLKTGKEDERRFVPLIRGLDEEAVQKINKSLETDKLRKADTPKFAGLHWREEQQRNYPQQTLAAHVIGFSNTDGVGQAGIEQSQNDLLYGAVIRKVEERDRLGRVYDETVSEKEPPKDIVLTIKNSIQYKTELALEKAVKAANAKSGTAIVIDHKNGEILAMANYPTFDPNNLAGITAENLSNRAVQGVYSPGSVFKLVTYSSALERKLITPDAMIDSGNGTIEIAKHKFTDSHAIGSVTYSKAFAHSSNVCAIKTGMRVGKEVFFSTLESFGFGRRVGIELPAETAGIVRAPARWNGDSLASMSIGYEIGVTALQMATAFATIANDGVKIQPHVIKEIRQFDEKSGSTRQPERLQVVSPDTARSLRGMLREVVLSGTGKRAQLNGYSSAGKTGTAWKFDEQLKRVNSAKYVSSFIGFAPAENPEVTIAVVMDEPKAGGRDGGQVAAPVFREIAEQILPELNVKPDLKIDSLIAENEEIPEAPVERSFAVPVEESVIKKSTEPEAKTSSKEPRTKIDKPKAFIAKTKTAKKAVTEPEKKTANATAPKKNFEGERPRVIIKRAERSQPEVKRKT